MPKNGHTGTAIKKYAQKAIKHAHETTNKTRKLALAVIDRAHIDEKKIKCAK